MSNQVNAKLLERAAELIDELTSHPAGYDKLIERAIEKNDLEEVHRLVTHVEAEISREYFYGYELL